MQQITSFQSGIIGQNAPDIPVKHRPHEIVQEDKIQIKNTDEQDRFGKKYDVLIQVIQADQQEESGQVLDGRILAEIEIKEDQGEKKTDYG